MAELPLPGKEPITRETMHIKLREELRDSYGLTPLHRYTMIVEGTTDRDYIALAAKLAFEKTGENLLSVPEHLRTVEFSTIGVLSPVGELELRRGGVSRMINLACCLKKYIHWLDDDFSGLLFVFDHDDAGRNARSALVESGYPADRHCLLLEARFHSGACSQRDTCIEHLLSLGIQRRFFESGRRWCDVTYIEGELASFKWHAKSKGQLRQYVLEKAVFDDVREVVRLIIRARTVFGLPVEMSIE